MGDTALRLLLLSALLAGCGKVAGNTPDAGPSDAGIDADLSGNATVVTQAVLPGSKVGDKVGSIDIVSHLPNNTILATATTDAGGNATIKVYPGGMVTAVYKHTVDMGADLITWAGVKPGDTLTFGSRTIAAGGTSTPLGTVNYTWPALGGVTQFSVITSCGTTFVSVATATSGSGTESSGCHTEPMDVMFRATNGNTLVGYGFRSNVPFTNGVTIGLGAWTTAIPNATINITGLDPEITQIFGDFFTVIDSTFTIFGGNYSGTPTGGAFSKMFSFQATGERTLGEVFLGRPGYNEMQILDSFSPSTLTETVATPVFPTWIQGSTNASSALQKVQWFLIPEPSTTPNTDGELLQLNWSRQISGVFHPWSWSVIMPPGQTAFAIPAMPPALADHAPSPNDFLGGFTTVFDIPSITGYDMLRTLPSANIMCLFCSVEAGDFQRVVLTQSGGG